MISLKKYSIILFFVILIISIYNSGTIMEQNQKKQMQKINVELDIFSGRPNPSWELTSAEISELTEYMAGLTPASKSAIANDLGYRGFIITNPGKLGGLPVKTHVFNGVLDVNEKGSTNYYNDVNDIESWLMERAREHGYGDIITELTNNKSI
jgi:hypothetical protein